MRRSVLTSCTAALLVASTAIVHALNPADLDILRLRLGMTESQAETVLLQQGVPATRMGRKAEPCPNADRCDVTITAPTRDGDLTVRMGWTDQETPRTLWQIIYVFKERAAGESQMIESSIAERFGPPDQARPMTWCQRPTPERICPTDQPSLRFLPQSLTLILSANAQQATQSRQP